MPTPLQPTRPAPPTGFGQAIRTFEQLPVANQELEALKDQAEKATGAEAVALNEKIRDQAK